jgi:hypothetical protein
MSLRLIIVLAGVYQEYKTLGLRQASTLTNFSSDTVYFAFCSLIHMSIARPRKVQGSSSATSSSDARQFMHVPVSLCIAPEHVADMVQQGLVDCSTSVKQWCVQWIE